MKSLLLYLLSPPYGTIMIKQNLKSSKKYVKNMASLFLIFQMTQSIFIITNTLMMDFILMQEELMNIPKIL